MDAGELVIKTVMNNDKFEKQYKRLENQYKNKEIDLNITLGDLENEQDELERLNKEGEKLQVTYNKIKKEKEKWTAQKMSVSTEIGPNSYQISDYKAYNEAIKQLDKLSYQENDILDSISKNTDEVLKQEQTVAKVNAKYEKQKNNLDLIGERIAEIQYNSQKADFSNLSKTVKDVGKEVGKSIKQISKMALAIFGIRSAYYMIRTAINDIGKSNKDVTDTISYAKTMMSTALEPLVLRIVNWIKVALAYINAIVKAWFDRDLFADTNANLKKANKQASALKKTLTGFDEMNILNSSSTGGGGGIPNLPSVEETGLFGWILENKDAVLGALSAITGALIAVKVAGLSPLSIILGAIMGLGLYTAISGILGLLNGFNWEDFGKVLQGLGIIIADIGVILLAIGTSSGPLGWILITIGALTGLIGTLTIELTKNRDGIKSVEQATNDLNDAKLAVYDADLEYTNSIKRETKAQEELAKAMKKTGIDAEELYKQVQDGTLKYNDLSSEQKNVYDAYLNLLTAQARIEASAKKLKEAKTEEVKKNIELELSNAKQEKSYDKLKKAVIDAYDSGMIKVGEASDYISRAMANMDYESMKVFAEDLPQNIKNGLDPYKYKTSMDKMRAWWNGEMQKFNSEIKVKVVVSGTIPEMRIQASYPGGKAFAKGGIYYPNLPKLASGGIVNQPGRGVPYHSALIGERGAEAVLPLTDSQQMERLASSIAERMVVRITNPIYMNGRLIAKEINQANADSDFAYNR